MKRSFDFGNKTGLQKKSQFNDVIFVEKSMETNQGSKNIAYVKSQFIYIMCTGKFMSEALIFASPNPQYDNTLFIELRVQYMKIPSSEHVVYTNWFVFVLVLTFTTIYVHKMFRACRFHVLDL